ncbi:MAG TPA: hypothetical protein EYM54_08050 [Dehalococcoidia bacterium]|nr:hypothetical protein [Dehalococcoidia bacterium]
MVESNPPGSIARVFIGRQTELAELEANVAEAVAGQGRLVMLAGEPGIGKTRTAEELGVLAEHREPRCSGAGAMKRKVCRRTGLGCRPSGPT